jgi:anaerobic magnesium-protoporphyrin IX monomethyl ester cyclase
MLVDFPAEKKELADYREKIRAFMPAMIVCDTSTASIESDIQSLSVLKSWLPPGVLGVLVGTHPTALPESALAQSPAVDVVARGEYDWTLSELASRPELMPEIPGISYRNGHEIVHNQDRAYSENLDELPFVSSVYRKHLNVSNYFYAHCRNPVISIFAGRGCPNYCSFCVYPQVMFGHRYRHRSVKHFVEELIYIKREFPQVREILVDDDNFTVDQDYVAEICNEIVRRRLRITWTCEARVNLRYEIMVKMKRAGCRLLVAGFESGDQHVLDNMNKGITLAQAEQFTKNAKKAGLRVHGCFMMGNRGETPETLRQTLKYSLRLPLDTAQYFPLMVYPGTEAYEWAFRNGYIEASSFRQWLTEDGMHNCVVNTDQLSARDLVDYCDYARRRFYLRPRYLLYKLTDVIKNRAEFKHTVMAAFKLMLHLFKKHQ